LLKVSENHIFTFKYNFQRGKNLGKNHFEGFRGETLSWIRYARWSVEVNVFTGFECRRQLIILVQFTGYRFFGRDTFGSVKQGLVIIPIRKFDIDQNIIRERTGLENPSPSWIAYYWYIFLGGVYNKKLAGIAANLIWIESRQSRKYSLVVIFADRIILYALKGRWFPVWVLKASWMAERKFENRIERKRPNIYLN
jgi:hypothetical protein